VAAYLITRMPATYAAADRVFEEVRGRLENVAITSVLDVGAGSGASTLAAQGWFEPSRITLIERNAAMAEVAREFLPKVEIRREDFARPEALDPHDLVIASYALCEAERPEVVLRLWAAARVALIVIEPGTPQGFARIRAIRRRLLDSGAHMVAPCPGAQDCPMSGRDWCHFAARVERTSLHRRLKEAELNYEDEKFSYVAVARQPGSPADARIIRRPRHQPGLIVLETCTPDGVQTVRTSKRDREKFPAARKAVWGGEFGG